MQARSVGQSFAVTFFAVVLLAAFLSPLVRAATYSIKSPEQISQVDSPIYPADPLQFTYKGRDYDVYQVPIDGATRSLALVKKGRAESQFVDPTKPSAGLITW